MKPPKAHTMNEEVMKTESNTPEIPDGSQDAQPVEAVDEGFAQMIEYHERIGRHAHENGESAQVAMHETYADLLRAALAHPRPTGAGIGTHAVIAEIAEAVKADKYVSDTDLASGVFGPAMTAFARKVASEYLSRPVAPTVEQAGEVVSTDNFGLTTEQIERLRMKSLKPDAISGDGVAQAERVGELVAWFARLATGSANPKWTTAHAYELAYYVATHAESRKVDIGATRNAAYIEGATISDDDRRMLERIGAIPTQPRAVGVPDGWKLVPIEPDQTMRRAGAAEVVAWGSTLDPCSVYRAMLAAAPAPEVKP